MRGLINNLESAHVDLFERDFSVGGKFDNLLKVASWRMHKITEESGAK